MQRRGTLYAIALLLLVVSTGWTTGTGEAAADAGGEFVIHMMKSEHPRYPIRTDEQLVFEWIYEQTGVRLEIDAVPSSSFVEKKNTLLATNNLPDVIQVTQPDLGQYGPLGAFVDLMEYQDSIPNLLRVIDEVPEIRWLFTDGSLYGFPKVNYDFQPGGEFPAIRLDLLRKHDLQVPTDFDELYDVLAALKSEYPDSYPWTARGLDSFMDSLSFAFGTVWGLAYDPAVDGGNYVYGAATRTMQDVVAYLNRLYDERILDPDFASNTDDVWRERMGTGKSFFFMDNSNFIPEINGVIRIDTPDADLMYIPYLANSSGTRRGLGYSPQWALGNDFAVSSKVDDPTRVIEFMDWLYSEEGANTTNWGKEGVTYEMVDGRPEFLDVMKDFETTKEANDYKEVELGLTLNVMVNYIAQRQWVANQRDYQNSVGYLRAQAFLDDPAYWQPPGLQPPLTPDELDEVGTIQTRLDTLVEQNIMRFIIGDRPVSEYGDFIRELESAGVRDLERIYRDALARASG